MRCARGSIGIRAAGVWALCAAAGAGAWAQSGPTCDARFLTPQGGMAAYWTFNNSGAPLIDDYAGHTGINHGAIWTLPGPVGGCMSFDGVNDYADISDAALNVPTWPRLTIAVWFLNDGGGDLTGYGQKVFDKSTMNSDFQLRLHPSGNLNFWSGSPTNPWANINDASHNYRDNQWHHAVVVKSGARGELWVDGVLKGVSDDLGSPSNSRPFLLGYSLHDDPYQRKHWSGLIDEFAIFNRVLNPTEVADLYTTSLGGSDYCASGGACYPDCDKSTGSGVLDIFDFLCFQMSYYHAETYACDCDTATGKGVCDIFDFLCFQNRFTAGCR